MQWFGDIPRLGPRQTLRTHGHACSLVSVLQSFSFGPEFISRVEARNQMSHWPNNTTSIITVIVGVVFLSGCTTRRREPTEFERKLAKAFQTEPGECIPRSWLLEELSDEAIASDPRVTPEARRMLQSRLPGDRVFFYRSPPETWAALLGRGGFAIVRDGKPCRALIQSSTENA